VKGGGERAVSSNFVAGQAKPETVSATPVKTWESNLTGRGSFMIKATCFD
jgi:hypothetical protein